MNAFKGMNKIYIGAVLAFALWLSVGCLLRNAEYFNALMALTPLFGAVTVLCALGWDRYFDKQKKKVDSKFYIPTVEQLTLASSYATKIMQETGWKDTDYVEERQDCNAYAAKKAITMKEWFYKNTDPSVELAFGIEPIGFVRRDGIKHAIVECYTGGESICFNVYSKDIAPASILDSERKTFMWTNF